MSTPAVFSWHDSTVLIATFTFIVTYIVLLTERVNRAIVAVLGAGVLVLSGVITQHDAIASVDFNTICLLLGMMIIVTVTKESGVFQYMAIWSAKKVKASPVGVLIVLSLVTAIFSALLDNVTTVLLTTPVILLIAKELKVPVYPYLFASIMASNIGGTATLIGDPPNIMIGSAADLPFNAFIWHLMPVSLLAFPATLLPILFIWRKDFHTTPEARAHIMAMDERKSITDKELLIKCLGVITLVLGGFVFGHEAGIKPATTAMMGAAVLLLLDNMHHESDAQHRRVHGAIAEAEWVTLFFFAGLFVVVHGLESVGVIRWLAEHMLQLTHGNFEHTVFITLWGSALLSAVVDNIPFVATMIPMVKNMAPAFGGHDAVEPLWWALALGSCLGGNGSLIGASANLVVAGFAAREGHEFSFLKFTLYAFPLMLISILICTVYVYFRYM